ncbi:hypothetical protein ANCDUO_01575 [Ancylostoma duodenale]|uniref:Acetyl-CoA hydrolase/transferase N-terminal domain-containing protein n=1 Tax=Ancylostoma duodenale TaxID=51022 RepID=A0A0C2DDT6_9BILA|nr:hypothetical protein ANCDUO_01575 [Ancylostoma duodenale]
MRERIESNSLFAGANSLKTVNEGIADFNSCFLYELIMLFRRGAIKLNAVIIHVSPPDENGYCSLCTSVDTTRAAAINANHIIAMANKHMLRTFGDNVIHSSHNDVLVEELTPSNFMRGISAKIARRKQRLDELLRNIWSTTVLLFKWVLAQCQM